jgi:hypothetical protein
MSQNNDSDSPVEHHDVPVPDEVKMKNKAEDLLTIFSDRCTVKFVSTNGEVETKVGRWCLVCK